LVGDAFRCLEAKKPAHLLCYHLHHHPHQRPETILHHRCRFLILGQAVLLINEEDINLNKLKIMTETHCSVDWEVWPMMEEVHQQYFLG